MMWLLWALASTQQTSPTAEDWLIDKQEWRGILTPGQAVFIENSHGTIRVRPSHGQEILVSGILQCHRDDPQKPRIQRQTTSSGLVLTIALDNGSQDHALDTRFFREKKRLDLTVYLPAGSPLKAVTRDQLFEGKGLRNDLVIETGDGPIKAITHGSVVAKTYRGSMDIRFTNRRWQKLSQLVTSAGKISVRLRPDANLDIDAQTRGLITTDFSLVIERHPTFPRRKTARACLGQDGKKLTIEAGQADVQLLLDVP